jgi:galacturan 1,4-alpha-galacturonidase
MSLHKFDYTKIYTADKVTKSSECIYIKDTCRTTGNFAVVMNAGSYAEWKIESCKSGKFTITVKYSSDIDSEIMAILGINSEEKATLKFVPCRYYARTKNEYRTGVMRCARAVVELEKGENTIFIKLPEYDKYGTVSIDTISVSDGWLCEMRQPIYDISDFTTDNDGTADCTEAFQRALDCCKDGGGTLYIHDGDYLISGAVINSDTTVYVDETARIYGNDDQNAYPIHNVSHTYIQEYSNGLKRCFIRKAVKTL